MKSLLVARDTLDERRSDEAITSGPIVSTPIRSTTTSRGERLIKFGLSIESEPPSGDDMTFTHAVFCQVDLSRSEVLGREGQLISGCRSRAGIQMDTHPLPLLADRNTIR